MASDSAVIKEFLVSVGVKFDANTLGKFNGLIGTLGKSVFGYAEILIAAATAVEVFVTAVADKLEDLYWSSKQLGSSVSAIQDYSLGIQNLGGSAEGAKQSLANLAMLIKTNPGFAALARSLSGGANPNDAVATLRGMGSTFRKMPSYLAWAYAQRFGIDYQTFLAIERGDPIDASGGSGGTFNSLYKAAGLDADKAALGAKNFGVQTRELNAQFTALSEILETRLLPYVTAANGVLLSFLTDFLGDKTPLNVVLDDVGALAKGLWDVGKAIGSFIYNLPGVAHFFHLVADIGKKTNGLAVAHAVTSGTASGLEAAAAIINGDKDAQQKAAAALKKATGISVTDGKNEPSVWDWKHWFDMPKTNEGWSPHPSDNNPGNLRIPGHKTGFATFPTLTAGMVGMARQLARDITVHGLTTLSALIGDPKWGYSPASDHNNPAWYSGFVSRKTGIGVNQKLDLSMIPSIMAAMTQIETRSHFTPKQIQNMLHMTQTTNIHVNGAGQSAQAVGKEVYNQQGRVNGDLLRNLKPALQ